MKYFQSTVQIGKNGLAPGIVETIKMHFKKRGSVKVVLLKSSGHTKENTKEIAEKIQEELGKNYMHRIVGFTIFLKRIKKEKQGFQMKR